VLAFTALQFALAGFGAFGHNYSPHALIGWVIAALSVLVLAAALVERRDRSTIFIAAALVVFTLILQPLLASLGGRSGGIHGGLGGALNQWVGALHAFIGLVIFGTAGRLMGAGRNSK
jgi:hypothetical protein